MASGNHIKKYRFRIIAHFLVFVLSREGVNESAKISQSKLTFDGRLVAMLLIKDATPGTSDSDIDLRNEDGTGTTAIVVRCLRSAIFC